MNQPPLVSPVSDFKDRRAGLIGFGILMILIGGFCALAVPLVLVSRSLAAQASDAAQYSHKIVNTIVVGDGLAVLFLGLGIGSIQARRWARALLLLLAWGWLAAGVAFVVAVQVVSPTIFARMAAKGVPLSATVQVVTLLGTLAFVSLTGLVLPGCVILFYRSRQVRATCEARDPVRRWTDACPVPVLGVSLWLGCMAVLRTWTALSTNGVEPFFGRFLSGGPGLTLALIVTGLGIYCARALYRLQPSGWWGALVLISLGTVSKVLTFLQADLIEMHRLMGESESQIARLQQSHLLTGAAMAGIVALVAVLFLGCLLAVKKHFRPLPPVQA